MVEQVLKSPPKPWRSLDSSTSPQASRKTLWDIDSGKMRGQLFLLETIMHLSKTTRWPSRGIITCPLKPWGSPDSWIKPPTISHRIWFCAWLIPYICLSWGSSCTVTTGKSILKLSGSSQLQGLTVEDLFRLTPRDNFEDELIVMADVRAYFTIACKIQAYLWNEKQWETKWQSYSASLITFHWRSTNPSIWLWQRDCPSTYWVAS